MTVVAIERVSMAAVCAKTDKWIVKKSSAQRTGKCLSLLSGDRTSVFLEVICAAAEKGETILIDL